ncbi:hypothetical protein C725_2612 [Pacificimonas flava]|uniref:Uncharacterized protein n=1 Tax=Pacificimonas flava TaxID=1234595 RepID=M2TJX0_9SPHN|nr:hypothetical protein C725_2612 [Pacificimonas flava]
MSPKRRPCRRPSAFNFQHISVCRFWARYPNETCRKMRGRPPPGKTRRRRWAHRSAFRHCQAARAAC